MTNEFGRKRCLVASSSAFFKRFVECRINDTLKGFYLDKASRFDEVLDKLRNDEVDILIIDRYTLGFNAEENTAALMRIAPELKVICYCGNECRKELGLRLYRAGIHSILVDTEYMTIRDCVSSVLTGKNYYPVELRQPIESKEYISMPEETSRVTKKEEELLKHMMRGITVKEICLNMKIAKSTYSNMKRRLEKKLGSTTTMETICIALQYGYR